MTSHFSHLPVTLVIKWKLTTKQNKVSIPKYLPYGLTLKERLTAPLSYVLEVAGAVQTCRPLREPSLR